MAAVQFGTAAAIPKTAASELVTLPLPCDSMDCLIHDDFKLVTI